MLSNDETNCGRPWNRRSGAPTSTRAPIADELARMETELPEADRAAFRQQVQGLPGRVTLNIDRGGFER